VALSGAITDNAGGISLTSNTGATLNLTGGVTLSTGANPAFVATGGGTISVTGANNTATSVGSTAINIANTTISSSNVTFKSVNANGGTNGIIVNNTGTAVGNGSFIVTGTSTTAGTGGTIQGTSEGALFTSTKNVQLSNMNFTNPNSGNGTVQNVDTASFNSAAKAGINMSSVVTAVFTNLNIDGGGGTGGVQVGINGQNVSDWTMTNSIIRGFGDAAAEGDVKMWNLSGTCVFTNNVLSFVSGDATGGENLFEVRNGTGVAGALTIQVNNNTFKDTRSSTNGSGGVAFTAVQSATMTLNIYNNSFLNLKTSGVETFARDTSTMTVNVYDGNVVGQGNTFDPQGGTGRAIGLNAEDTANLKFNILRNVKIWGGGGPIINVIGINSAVIEGRINNNTDIKGQGLSVPGSGINLHPEDNSRGTFEIKSNTVTNIGQDVGIWVFNHGDGTSLLSPQIDATIGSNSVAIVNNGNTGAYVGATTGIQVQAGANNNDTAKTCVNVTNNSVTASPTPINGNNNIAEVTREGSTGSNLYFQGFVAGGSNNARAVATWNGGSNTPSNMAAAIDAGSAQAYSAPPAGSPYFNTCRTVTLAAP
jgi:hypothetical protein